MIISGLFFSASILKKGVDELSFKDLPGVDAAFGGAIVIVGEEGGSDALEKGLGKRFTKLETKVGSLCQFEEKEGKREHVYYLTSTADSAGLEHFLTVDFPLFDFEIHKLHMERDYFENQQTWIIKEKAEIDRTVGEILHKRIAGESLNPEFLGGLEKDIDHLSSKYAILVNDGHLVREAKTTLEDDIEMVHRRLEEFGKVPEEGLSIVKHSMELKKRLEEAEISISFAIKNTKTAIDTVRTNVDLLRSRENIKIQEESVSFQVAAGVLEFIIIFYYSLTSWLHLLGEERFEFIAPTVRFITIFLFASSAVVLTHFVGESYKEKWKLNRGMIISAATMLFVFIYILFISIQTAQLLAAEVLH